jgi:hypothetical protein
MRIINGETFEYSSFIENNCEGVKTFILEFLVTGLNKPRIVSIAQNVEIMDVEAALDSLEARYKIKVTNP